MAEAETRLPATVSDSQLPQSDAAVDSFFASVGRDGLRELQSATVLLQGVPLLQEIVDAMPIPVTVLNQKGQVLLMNRRACHWLGVGVDCALGKRHGDLLCCLHSQEGSDGCGTSQHCRSCGAAVSISTAQERQGQAVQEYHLTRITRLGEEAIELQVTTTPIRIEGQAFTIFAVTEPRMHTQGDLLLFEAPK